MLPKESYRMYSPAHGGEFPVVFPSTINHDEYRNFFPSDWVVVSAGMIRFDDCLAADYKIYCYGDSFSLRTKGRGNIDNDIIKNRISM